MGGKRVVYKFLASKYADSFVSLGVLRLGAAKEFREIEGSAGGRGDENELKAIWNADGRFELAPDDPFLVGILGRPFGCNAPKVVIQGGPGVFIHLHSDALLYSTSAELTNEIAERMRVDFGAGACVQISDFDEFTKIVAMHPDVRATSWQVSPVTYVNSKQVKKFTGLNPAEKEDAFAWQKEVRGIFALMPAPQQGRIIAAPDVTHLLKREC